MGRFHCESASGFHILEFKEYAIINVLLIKRRERCKTAFAYSKQKINEFENKTLNNRHYEQIHHIVLKIDHRIFGH